MKSFTLTELNSRPGSVIDAASRSPVSLTKHGKPRFVVMSVEDYETRIAGNNPQRAYRWDEAPDELVELFLPELERLARGEGYDDPI